MNIELLKQLREETGISMAECKKALEEAADDLKRAKEILREKGKEMIKGREGRVAGKGLIDSYIHSNGTVGVLLELNCESDFVAKSDDFKELAHELCLHIAAASPLVVSDVDISEDIINAERKIYEKQAEESGKPKEIAAKMIDGKLAKYKKDVSLLSQMWIKDNTKTIEALVNEYRAKIGEQIQVKRFTRYQI